jgi:hypothetical protein
MKPVSLELLVPDDWDEAKIVEIAERSAHVAEVAHVFCGLLAHDGDWDDCEIDSVEEDPDLHSFKLIGKGNLLIDPLQMSKTELHETLNIERVDILDNSKAVAPESGLAL